MTAQSSTYISPHTDGCLSDSTADIVSYLNGYSGISYIRSYPDGYFLGNLLKEEVSTA